MFWDRLFKGVCDKHAPLIKRRVKRDKQPDWLTDELLQAISTRDQYKATHDHINYKIWRNKCVAINRKIKRKFFLKVL